MDIKPHQKALRSYSSLALIACTFLTTLGCGASSNLLQVQGKIVVDGTPAKGAVLLFHPDGGTSTSVSSGQAKDDGTFTVVTDTKPGIPPGNYLVTVTWPDPSHVASDRDKLLGMAEPGKDLLNGRYVTKDRGIKLSIAEGTTTIAPIELKTK